jgi:hypothetical protein
VVVPVSCCVGRGKDRHTLGLAGFAALGLILELFVVKKHLFPGGKDKVSAAVDAGQYFILKFH